MNKTFLSILTTVFLSSTALADNGVDLGVYGGFNYSSDYGSSSNWFSVDANPSAGGVAGITLGKELTGIKGLQTVFEIGVRTADLSPNVVICGDTIEGLDGSDQTNHIMLDAKYQFDTGVEKVGAYVLAGAGWGSRSVEVTDNSGPLGDIHSHNSGFVWQVGAGLSTPVGDNNTLGIGYRYFKSPNVIIDAGFTSVKTEDDNHSAIVEWTHHFNAS